MSRSANTLSALKSAPASFGTVNTMVVLSGGPSGAASRPMTRKRVKLSATSWIAVSITVRPNTAAARSDAMAALSVRPCSLIILALPAVS